jgi:hypothetical protein
MRTYMNADLSECLLYISMALMQENLPAIVSLHVHNVLDVVPVKRGVVGNSCECMESFAHAYYNTHTLFPHI